MDRNSASFRGLPLVAGRVTVTRSACDSRFAPSRCLHQNTSCNQRVWNPSASYFCRQHHDRHFEDAIPLFRDLHLRKKLPFDSFCVKLYRRAISAELRQGNERQRMGIFLHLRSCSREKRCLAVQTVKRVLRVLASPLPYLKEFEPVYTGRYVPQI